MVELVLDEREIERETERETERERGGFRKMGRRHCYDWFLLI